MSFPISNSSRTTLDAFMIQSSKKFNSLNEEPLKIICEYYYIPLSGIQGEDLGFDDDPYLEDSFKYSWHVKDLICKSALNQFKVMYALFQSNGYSDKHPFLKKQLQTIALDEGQYKYVPKFMREDVSAPSRVVELQDIPLDSNQKMCYISTLIAAVRKVEATTLRILCNFIKADSRGPEMLNYALWEACYHKKISDTIPRVLIEFGANVNLSDNESVLMQSIRSQNFDTAKALIALKANVNFQGRTDKQTALHLACSYAPALIEPLLKAGADPNIVDNSNRTPLHLLHHERRFSQTTIDTAHAMLVTKTDSGMKDAGGNLVYSEIHGHRLSAHAAANGFSAPLTPHEHKQSGLFGNWF